MNRTVDLDELATRPTRHMPKNGLFELILGPIMLAGSAAELLPMYWSTIFFLVAMLAGGWGLRTIVAATITRTGYIAPRTSSRAIVFWIVMVVAVIMLYLVVKGPNLPDFKGWDGIGLSILYAGCFLFCGVSQSWHHLTAIGILSLVIAAVAYRFGAPDDIGTWVSLGVGGALTISGLLLLRAFLKANLAGTEEAGS